MEKSTGGTGQKGDRHEYGDENSSCGDDSEEDASRALYGRAAWTHAICALPLYALKHYDGVVDNQAGRQYQGQQGQNIDGEAQHPTRRQRAEKRDGDGDGRHQCQPHGSGE